MSDNTPAPTPAPAPAPAPAAAPAPSADSAAGMASSSLMRIVIVILGIGLLALIGAVIALSVQGKEIPPALNTLTSLIGGGLVGFLTPHVASQSGGADKGGNGN